MNHQTHPKPTNLPGVFFTLAQIKKNGWETLGGGIIAVLSHEKLLVPRLPLRDYINLN